jgi:hypothetical protein
MDEAREPIGGQEVLPPVKVKRPRKDGWSPRKKQLFLEALAHKASMTEAARNVGMSMTSVRNLRKREPDFARACEAALAAIRPSLMEAAYQRGVLGVDEPVFQGGKLVGVKKKYSDGMLRLLIDRNYDPAAEAETQVVGGTMTKDEIEAALCKKLDALERMLKRKEQAARLAWCERMEREGKAP